VHQEELLVVAANESFGFFAQPLTAAAATAAAARLPRWVAASGLDAALSFLATAAASATGGGMVKEGSPAIGGLEVTIAEHAGSVRLEAAGGVRVGGQLYVAPEQVVTKFVNM
jgi:hypothetical protein